MVDVAQIQQLMELVAGILGFVILVMMFAITHKLRGGLLYRALVPWTIALFLVGVEEMLRVFILLDPLVQESLQLLRIILYLTGGVILWNRLRDVG